MRNQVGAWEDITDQALLAAYNEAESIRGLIEAAGWEVDKMVVWRRLKGIPGYRPKPQHPCPAQVSTERLARMRYEDGLTLREIAQILEREGVEITPSGIHRRLERHHTPQEQRA